MKKPKDSTAYTWTSSCSTHAIAEQAQHQRHHEIGIAGFPLVSPVPGTKPASADSRDNNIGDVKLQADLPQGNGDVGIDVDDEVVEE